MPETPDLFDISQKLLAYVYSNEPVDNEKIIDLIMNSKLSEETIKLNIERLHDAGLIRGIFVKPGNKQYFVGVINLTLSYAGILELGNLIRRMENKGASSFLTINIGEFNFDLNLAKLKVG